MEKEYQRRVAVIAAIDVVGFSRLVAADEHGTISRLNRYLDEDLRPAVERHGGRVIKVMGDGALMEFQSVHDALDTLISFGRHLIASEEGRPPESRFAIRGGINLGDIYLDAEDVYGHGVNLAARLEEIAPANTICLSGSARAALGDRRPFAFDDLGERTVKNIAEPVRVWACRIDATRDHEAASRVTARGSHRRRLGILLVAAGLVAAAVVGVSDLLPQDPPTDENLAELQSRPGVAVLPFDNLSPDPEQSYFATGLTEELTAQLARFTNIRVIARNSASRFGGGSEDLREVSNALGVRFIVEGSVRRDSDRVRVTAQLIDGETGDHIWSTSFDESLSARAILDIQEEIASSVASNIAGLSGVVRKSATVPSATRPDDMAAYDCVHLHYRFWDSFDQEIHARARECLERAVKRYPDFALGWAELAYTYWTEHAYGMNPEPNALDRAKAAAEKAIELDPNMAEGYGALSQTYRSMKMADEAVAAAERAFAINPNNVGILGGAGCMLTFTGRLERAEVFLGRAMALDPFAPWWIPYCKAIWHIQSDDPEAALDLLDAHSGPEIWLLGFARIVALVEVGREVEASAMRTRLLAGTPDLDERATGYIEKNFWALPEFADRLRSALQTAGMPGG